MSLITSPIVVLACPNKPPSDFMTARNSIVDECVKILDTCCFKASPIVILEYFAKDVLKAVIIGL
jgi:hypothetical protein